MWYSGAMIQKGLVFVAALLLVSPLRPVAFAQSNSSAGSLSNPHVARPSTLPGSQGQRASAQKAAQAARLAAKPTTPAASTAAPSTSAGAAPAGSAAGPTDCLGANCDYQPAHISIATPAPAPAPWTWQQRVTWGANIVLLVLGYVAILVALSLLRKIERQTRYGETAAQAAQETAQAALSQTQALVRAERPWIIMGVRPSQTIENGFSVIATNRGRGPARILSTIDEIVSAVDEAHLAEKPEYRNQPVAPEDPLILLPGETTEILSFSRAEVKRICETEERLARVVKWEEKIYLYGRVEYRDLSAPDDAPAHHSSWFCWYIHGRQKSGMVMAGPQGYNRHT